MTPRHLVTISTYSATLRRGRTARARQVPGQNCRHNEEWKPLATAFEGKVAPKLVLHSIFEPWSTTGTVGDREGLRLATPLGTKTEKDVWTLHLPLLADVQLSGAYISCGQELRLPAVPGLLLAHVHYDPSRAYARHCNCWSPHVRRGGLQAATTHDQTQTELPTR